MKYEAVSKDSYFLSDDVRSIRVIYLMCLLGYRCEEKLVKFLTQVK